MANHYSLSLSPYPSSPLLPPSHISFPSKPVPSFSHIHPISTLSNQSRRIFGAKNPDKSPSGTVGNPFAASIKALKHVPTHHHHQNSSPPVIAPSLTQPRRRPTDLPRRRQTHSNIYHPLIQVTNPNAPAVLNSFPARIAFPPAVLA